MFLFFLPKRTWSGIRLEHPVSLRRLGVLFALTLIAVHIALASRALVVRWSNNVFIAGKIYQFGHGTSDRRPEAWLADLLWPYSEWVHDIFRTDAVSYSWDLVPGITSLSFFVLPTLMLMLLPETRARARVHWKHIVRAGVYTFALAPLICVCFMVIDIVLIELDALCSTMGLLSGNGFLFHQSRLSALVLFGVFFAVYARWWLKIVTTYMKLQHAWVVLLSIMIVTLLGAMVFGVVIVPMMGLG